MSRAAAEGPTLVAAQAAGFPVGGEPLAVDLADTLVTVTDPPTDLLADDERCAAFWELQKPRLPAAGAAPSITQTRNLRAAVREVLDARLSAQRPTAQALDAINRSAASVPTSGTIAIDSDGMPLTGTRWHSGNGEAITLAAVAQSLIELLAGPSVERLRRCANPACSMLFVATDVRRKWCTQNICGNRTRAARHYHRHHQT
jgi:predicted RNA-binding Zn ribbon-like protein